MVRPNEKFVEGPSHVVPLLLNCIPGIDSNDMDKCIAVFRFVSTLAAHIRIEDFSHLVDQRPDLSLEHQQICFLSRQFEDFVIQFMDKCFCLIDNCSSALFSSLDQESRSRNGEEGVVEAAISSVTLSILNHASDQIKRAALDKLYTYVTNHIFDTKTQGKAISTLCLACAKALPEETLDKFVPHFCRLVLTTTENESVYSDKTLDDELLFSLLLISEIVRCNSPHLLKYKEIIITVLHRALKLKLREGYMLGCSVLRHLIRALTSISCNDHKNIDFEQENSNDDDLQKLPFEKWGATTHIRELKLRWDMPTEESRCFARRLLEIFLRSAVENLLAWSRGETDLKPSEVQRYLQIVLSCLVGAASVLPTLSSPSIDLCPYEVPLIPMYVHNTGTEPLDFEDGTNVRTYIVEAMRRVLQHIKVAREYDINSCSLICEIFSIAISYFGYNKTELRLAAQRIKSMKNSFQHKLLGSKRHLRYVLVERVTQQHKAMLLNKGQTNFTQLHLEILKQMFDLSLSHYVEVRILAQDAVYLMLNYFPFSENILVPMIVQELKQENIEHKGSKDYFIYWLVEDHTVQ